MLVFLSIDNFFLHDHTQKPRELSSARKKSHDRYIIRFVIEIFPSVSSFVAVMQISVAAGQHKRNRGGNKTAA